MKNFTQNVLENGRNSFKKTVAVCGFLLMSGLSFGQTTIATEGFNNISTLFTVSGGAFYNGNSATGDRPASSSFSVEGTHCYGLNAISTTTETATMTTNDINTIAFSGVSATFRLAAFSIGSTGNGMDGTDIVAVSISPDGGTNYYSTVRVLGNSNAYWSYGAGTGIASTAYDGNATSIDFAPTAGGNRTNDGYSTVIITNLPVVTNLRIRITLTNNATTERWVLDDFKVTGTSAITSAQTGNWSSTSTWVGGVVPTSADNVIIASGHVVTIDTTTGGINTRNSGTTTTVDAGGTLATSVQYINNGTTTINGAFQLNAGGFTNSGNNFIYGAASTLNFNNTSSYGVNNTDQYWPTTNGPFNVSILQGGMTLNSGANRVVSGTFQTAAGVTLTSATLTLNGTARINAGGFFNNSPIYGSASTLVYNIGAVYGRGSEWTTATSGAGYPANVQISNPGTVTTINMGTTSAQCSGNLIIDASATLNTTSAGLTVVGSVTSNGTISLGGDVTTQGNWTIGASGTQTNNSKAVFFTAATGNQTITKTGSGTVFFDYLVINKAAGNVLLSSSPATDVTINTTAGDVLQLLNVGSLDLNGRTLTLNNNGGNIAANATGRTITSGVTGATLAITGTKSFSGAGTLVININVTTVLSAGFDFGVNKVTIDGVLQLNNGGFASNGTAPIYAIGSTLLFNSGGNYDMHNLSADVAAWFRNVPSTGTAQAGVPWNVTISNNTALKYNTANNDIFPRYINGNLIINTGSTFTLGGFIGTAGDFFLRGNWTNNGTFIPNNRLVTFNGSFAQTLTGATTFDYLKMDNSTGLTLNNSITNTLTLDLTSGVITLGANDLTIGSAGTVINASATSYVRTNGTGQFKSTVGSSATLFPTGNTAYNPITFTNSGTSDVYGVRVINTAPAGLNPTKTITRQWITTENVAGGSNLAVVAQYNNGETGAGFGTATDNFIGFYNGTTWEQVPATHTGGNPFTVSSTANFLSTDISTGTQYFAIGRDNAFKSDAVKYVVTSINPASPGAGYPFSVTVQAQDIYNAPTNVTSNSTFTLSTNGNAGAIGGTVTGTILSGTNSIVVSGVTLATAGTGATITATNTSGLSLTTGTSAAFNVLAAATQLQFQSVPATGIAATNLTSFTVRALRADNSLDTNFTGNITISKATGTGNLTGTLTVAAIAGVATFSAAQFDAVSTYTLNANSGSLTQATSGNIVVSLAPVSIFANPITGTNPNTANPYTTGQTFDSNITVSGIGRGSGITGSSANNRYNATGWTTASTINANDFIEFSLTPNLGYYIDFYEFEFSNQSSSTGPLNFAVRSNLNNFSTDLGVFTNPNNNVAQTDVISLSGNEYNNITSTIIYRVYGYNAGDGTGTGSINDFIFRGNVLCIRPTAFNVTGGGVICSGSSAPVGLSSSQLGINYQLKVNGSNIGLTVAGTGSAISFGNQNTIGTYTVVATNTNGTCNETETMTGNVSISISSTTATWDPALYSANSPANWSEAPAANKNIVINGNYTSAGNLSGCSCSIQSGNVIISSGDTLFINNALNVSAGTIIFENNASLIQTNNVTNTGNITYKRTATNIDGSDYVFWSSPVVGQSVGSVHLDPGPIFVWNTLAPNSNGASGNTSQGAWQAATGAMEPAKGYIIRGSSSYSATNMTINSTFIGVPRNGNIGYTVVRGDFQGTNYNGSNGVQITNLDDNHNLIGNPYPSAIRASEFITLNTFHATLNPTGQLLGTVKLWQHGAAPSNTNTNPFYGTYINNYANDYLTINSLGTLPYNGSEIIKAGQGFFVTMVDGPTGNGTANFTNAMRVDASGNPLDNAGFFRMATESTSNNEKSRIWLDLINTQNNSSVANTLVGYLNQATNDYDSLYDAVTKLETGNGLFSNIANKLYEIQGRATFTTTDEVPLTIKINNAGNYKIGINAIDGLFLGNQDIFIKDNLLNVYHNIKLSPYAFDTVNGVFGDRFKIVYQNPLNNTSPELETVNIYKSNQVIYVNSKENIKSVTIFDITGRVLATNNNVNNTQFSYNTELFATGVLIVQVTTEDGKVSTKKVL